MIELPSHLSLHSPAVRRSLISSAIFLLVNVALFAWISSASFEQMVRARLISELENSLGGRIEIASLHWKPLQLAVDAEGIVIHGLEGPDEEPYARIRKLHIAVSIRGMFWTPSVLLRDLEITQPALHLIVNADGSTNQPQPRRKMKSSNLSTDTLFRLEAKRVVLTNGVFRLNDQRTQLSLDARSLAVALAYQPAVKSSPESYHLTVQVNNLLMTRGINSDLTQARKGSPHADFRIETTLDLTPSATYLRSLRLISNAHELDVTGTLQNYARPLWRAQCRGELDMSLLQPLVGYQDVPRGIARMNLVGEGRDGIFRVDGSLHAFDGSYSIPGVEASGIVLDAHAHADPNMLFVSGITIRFPHGGTMTGQLRLIHWLPPVPGTAHIAPPRAASHSLAAHSHGVTSGPVIVKNLAADGTPINIPVDGKITAQLNAVSIDSILEIVTARAFHRLGFDGLVSGPISGDWFGGDVRTLTVGAMLAIAPSNRSVPGEVPTSGSIDGTYIQKDGSVTLRALNVQLPASRVQAHGHLGAYPIYSATGIALDFSSSDLGEFDGVLKSLDFQRNKVRGAAALPILLKGKSSFKGLWDGSLLDPRLSGNLTATNLSVEMPPRSSDAAATPQWSSWDSVNLAGSYSSTHVLISSARLVHGAGVIELAGTLDAAKRRLPSRIRPAPDFGADSRLNLHVRAHGIPSEEIYSLTGQTAPITGTLAAELQANGFLRSLAGTGWAELTAATVYGEPIKRVHAQGSIDGTYLKFSSLLVDAPAGKLEGSGTYDLRTRQLNVEAHGANLQLARINTLHTQMPRVDGRLNFAATAAGTLNDPTLEGHANVSGLVLSNDGIAGETFQVAAPASIEIQAHTTNHILIYDLSSHLQTAELVAHGQTHLSADYETQAQIRIARFNVAALLSHSALQRLNGETSIDGTVSIEGPLAHLQELRGDARLTTVSATVQGVQLTTQGPVHASFAHSRVVVDPVHITGDQTDVRTQGDFMISGNQPLNLQANGSINLKLLETLDRDITASGMTTFQVQAHGTLTDPDLRGTIDVQNGALALEDMPNGLSQIRGSLQFNQNRLEAHNLTAMSGGGMLTLNGYLAYQKELYADLSVTGKSIRIRYPQGVSSVADATLHLAGSQTNMLLSGNVVLNRFSLNPDLDMTALAAQASAVRPVIALDAPSNHWRLDLHIVSAPQLNFQNAFAKLAGNVDLRLRGTVATPSLLGRISITEGSTTIAGTHYDLERGEIVFNNPVRIQPTVDLNATAHVQDYDITLGIHGTIQRPTISYRSEPPLPEADVIALLALGHTNEQQRLYMQQQESANPISDALLGGALNATVTNRVQKLFGAGSVKVDPSYLGAQGNSTSRITVQEQVGKAVTLTFATNANSTSQQLIQAEIAVNHHVSLLVARDESGVFSVVLKATRRYR